MRSRLVGLITGMILANEATIFEVCDSPEEARESMDDYGYCCVYSYALDNNELVDEQYEFDNIPKEQLEVKT